MPMPPFLSHPSMRKPLPDNSSQPHPLTEFMLPPRASLAQSGLDAAHGEEVPQHGEGQVQEREEAALLARSKEMGQADEGQRDSEQQQQDGGVPSVEYLTPSEDLPTSGDGVQSAEVPPSANVSPSEDVQPFGDVPPPTDGASPAENQDAMVDESDRDNAERNDASAAVASNSQPPAASSSTEIIPLPVQDTSALNLFLDAADYLDWDLPMEGARHTSGSGAGGEGGTGPTELSESMGAMLEAQRLMSARSGEAGAAVEGEPSAAADRGQDGSQPWQEHVELLMGLGQGGTAGEGTDNAIASSSKRPLQEAETDGMESPTADGRPIKRARGTGRKSTGGTSRRQRGSKSKTHDDAHGEGESSTRHAPGPKDLLTEEQRRANHISSEQRRRNAIKIGYAELGCLEHISVNVPWPSSEDLVDETGQIRADPGVHIQGRLIPVAVPVKSKKKRGTGATTAAEGESLAAEEDGQNGDAAEEVVVYKKPPPNKVAKGWSKNAVLQKGAALSRWLREGNQWLEAEIARLEMLIGETAADGNEVEQVRQVADAFPETSYQPEIEIDPALAVDSVEEEHPEAPIE